MKLPLMELLNDEEIPKVEISETKPEEIEQDLKQSHVCEHCKSLKRLIFLNNKVCCIDCKNPIYGFFKCSQELCRAILGINIFGGFDFKTKKIYCTKHATENNIPVFKLEESFLIEQGLISKDEQKQHLERLQQRQKSFEPPQTVLDLPETTRMELLTICREYVNDSWNLPNIKTTHCLSSTWKANKETSFILPALVLLLNDYERRCNGHDRPESVS